jgi:septum formation protein
VQAAERLARAKAAACRIDHASAPAIVAADTMVLLDGRVLGKPRDAADAADMLAALSGRWHEVVTGWAVAAPDRLISGAEITRVRFRPLEPAEIAAYVATGEPLDKAGAYGIQGRAALFVPAIEGDYFTVVGLPLARIGEALKNLGIRLSQQT